jgi:hypothetical protein
LSVANMTESFLEKRKYLSNRTISSTHLKHHSEYTL